MHSWLHGSGREKGRLRSCVKQSQQSCRLRPSIVCSGPLGVRGGRHSTSGSAAASVLPAHMPLTTQHCCAERPSTSSLPSTSVAGGAQTMSGSDGPLLPLHIPVVSQPAADVYQVSEDSIGQQHARQIKK